MITVTLNTSGNIDAYATGQKTLTGFAKKYATKHVQTFYQLDKPAEIYLYLESKPTSEKLRKLGAYFYLHAAKFSVVHLDCAFLTHFAQSFFEGFLLSSYQYKGHKSIPSPSPSLTLVLNSEKVFASYQKAKIITESVFLTQDWSNEPSNIGTPSYYNDQAKKYAQQFGLKYHCINKAHQKSQGMGLFLGVNQGSDKEGFIVILEYAPKNPKKTIALVGKGVTFDSGGISIKPALKMEEMKHDMTGAATVFGATIAAAQLQSPYRIITVMAFTENMPAANALQPGNVIRSRSGKTVEIFNTDAEGRLILGDAIDVAQDYQPDEIIDVATLTGAVGVALGKVCAGILSNNHTLSRHLIQSGHITHERLWRLPLYKEYFEDLRSDIADMKNSANDSYAGTIRGAIFIQQFIKNKTPWAHLDIAATAYNNGNAPYIPKKGASGKFVRLLVHYLTTEHVN